ncbi:DUF2884 family protein [Vibrio breoganii]|uniref:DUF2884 family protein n=1 Tax=Vibrio breoganii TaxID=553239 RepID=UPI000C84B4CB|nr:DUF2884 family protein [Vibrio breoganii]PMO31039.1 chemotaxis protein [Vibrio breoganii]
MIKRITSSILVGSLLVAPALQAQALADYESCNVDLNNELHLDGKEVEIIDREGHRAVFEAKGLVIDGESIPLNKEQQQLLDHYRVQLNSDIPKAREVAQSGVDLANEVLDDVSAKFNDTDAFDNVRQAIDDFYAKLEQRYYQDGEWVLKPNAFGNMFDNWQQDFADAREVFNSEFFASAFSVLQEKLASEDGINFTELQKQLNDLKVSVEKKLQQHSSEISEKAQDYCDSMGKLAEEEQSLIKTIPELENYQLFNI